MPLGGWIMSAATVPPSIGCWKGQRVAGAVVLARFFTMCCNRGDIELPPMAPPPDQLSNFFTAVTPQADRFRQHIRQYNAALAFASLGVEVDSSIDEGGGGPPTFRIHGELCHRLGSLLPSHGAYPMYA